jgi:hypothetical protein
MPPGRYNSADYIDLILNGPLWDVYTEQSEEKGIIKVMEDGAPVH